MAKEKKSQEIEIVNKKAAYEYHFLDEYEAGIVLTGTEIKSIRKGEVNMSDAYCLFKRGELIIKNLFIAEYKFGNVHNHDPKRDRKLLLKKGELKKLEKKVKERGFTIIPYRIYLSDRGFAKVEVILGKGKKSYDKRETIKQRDQKRDMERMKKMY